MHFCLHLASLLGFLAAKSPAAEKEVPQHLPLAPQTREGPGGTMACPNSPVNSQSGEVRANLLTQEAPGVLLALRGFYIFSLFFKVLILVLRMVPACGIMG